MSRARRRGRVLAVTIRVSAVGGPLTTIGVPGVADPVALAGVSG